MKDAPVAGIHNSKMMKAVWFFCDLSIVKPFLPLLLAALVASCGADNPRAGKDTASAQRDAAHTVADRRDIHNSCCFQDEEDFRPFLPPVCGKFELEMYDSEIYCPGDTLKHSTVFASYSDGDGHGVQVRITDYCPTPDLLATDYELKTGMLKGTEQEPGEFNEFDVPGSHRGCTAFNPSNRTAKLVLVADNRFLVEITDHVCENTKGILSIYEALPLQKFAALGK